jgi:hypothetical protein
MVLFQQFFEDFVVVKLDRGEKGTREVLVKHAELKDLGVSAMNCALADLVSKFAQASRIRRKHWTEP